MIFGALAAVALMVPAGGARICGTTTSAPATYHHVVWVVMENHDYGSIVGARDAPYVNRLARQCGSARRFYAETHPSLSNYLAMTSGSAHGVADDGPPSVHPVRGRSIFSQLGSGWRSLQESMPSRCRRTDSGLYAVKHNPAAYYTRARARCRAQDVALTAKPRLSARFTFVTPNLCHDTHNCPVATGDAWLRTFLGKVFASREYRAGRTAVFLTWDEDDSAHSNHIATLVAAPSVRPGTAPRQRFDHYSLLRTTEELLGLPFVGRAAKARSMRPAFGL